MLKRFWVGWNQYTKDYRPLNFPPNKKIKGYWCSGYSGVFNEDGSPLYYTMCALVEASSVKSATNALLKDWPECTHDDWRFFDEKDVNWIPSDRFKLITYN